MASSITDKHAGVFEKFKMQDTMVAITRLCPLYFQYIEW